MVRSLIVLPDDSAKPILTAIDAAARTLRVKMFAFSDPSLLKAAMVGSINLAPGSLEEGRELAIEGRDRAVVDRLHHVVRHDWEPSHPLDLSDHGLLADLEDRVKGSAHLLAIDHDHHDDD